MNFKFTTNILLAVFSIFSLHSNTNCSQEIEWNNYSKFIIKGINNLIIKPDEYKERLVLEADESTLQNITIETKENCLGLEHISKEESNSETHVDAKPVKEKNKIKAVLYVKNLNQLLIEVYEPLLIELEGPLWGKDFQVLAKDSFFGGLAQGRSMMFNSSTDMSGNSYRLTGLFGSFRISYLTLYVNYGFFGPFTPVIEFVKSMYKKIVGK